MLVRTTTLESDRHGDSHDRHGDSHTHRGKNDESGYRADPFLLCPPGGESIVYESRSEDKSRRNREEKHTKHQPWEEAI